MYFDSLKQKLKQIELNSFKSNTECEIIYKLHEVNPQFDFLTDDYSEGLNKFGLGLGFGIRYDFSDKLFVASRYSLGLSNRIQDAL